MRRKIGALYMLTKAQAEAFDLKDVDVYAELDDQIRAYADTKGYALEEPITHLVERFPYPHTSSPEVKANTPMIEWRAWTIGELVVVPGEN